MTAPHDRTADQFDAWLEAASQQAARPTSPNGATDPAAYDLVTTAHEFHASIRAAEQRAVPAIPANAIWEDVMTSTTAGTISIPALAPSGADSPPKAPTRPISDSPWPKPVPWAVPAFLVVAAMIGILWFYSSFFGSTDPGPTPTSQPGFAFSTPTEEAIDSDLLAPVTRSDCDVTPLTLEEIGAYQVDPGESVPREYGPIAPVSDAEAIALFESSFTLQACEAFGDPGQKQAIRSPRLVFEGPHDSIARNSASVEEYIANNQALAEALLDPNRTTYTAVSSTDNPYYEQATPATIDSWFGSRLLPQDVVQFPDGRMGGPLTWVVPANYDDYRLAAYEENNEPTPTPYEFTMVEYAIFVEHDGQWLLDERFTLCAANCDQWLPHAALIYQSAQSLVHTPTPIVLPGTPVMSPVASPTIATPTDDIDEWLVDPATYSCEDGFSATITPESRPVGGWPTDRPMDVDDYLPLTSAPATDQRAIAKRYVQMNSNCLPTSDDPVFSDDFHWMPGPSVATATANQIETAQQISAALPMQEYRDYFIVQPPPLGTPAPGESTPTMNGSGILLPQDVVQLPDGRIGAPLRILIETDDPDGAIHAMTGGRDLAAFVFLVFEWEGDHWFYDELFLFCVGDCDEYWAVVAGDLPVDTLATPLATPAASPAASLLPITPSECTVEGLSQDEVSAIIRNASEPDIRSWVPVGPVDPATAAQINQVDRAWQACDAFGSIGQRTVFQTDHLTSSGPEPLFPDHAPSVDAFLLGLQRFDERRALGEGILASMDAYLTTTQAVVDIHGFGDTLPFDQRISFPVTESAIFLADGRVALPVVDPYLLYSWEAGLERGTYQFVYMPVHILAPDSESDSWLVDEVFHVCVGDCDAARDLIADLGETYGIDLSATPDATTQFGIDDAQLEPGECTVPPLTNVEISALQQNPGDYPARQYGPTSRVDLAVGEDIAELNREFLACANEGNWRSMASQRLIHETQATGSYLQTSFASAAQAQGMTGEEYIAWHQDVSSTVLPGNLSAYVIFTDRDTSTMTGRLVQPHQVVQLADGRIGAPETTVLPTGQDIDGMPFLAVTFNIYIQEAGGNNRWVLDESLTLCIGECDMFYDMMSSDLASLPVNTPTASPVATPRSTPIATPVDNRSSRFD